MGRDLMISDVLYWVMLKWSFLERCEQDWCGMELGGP